MMGAMVMICLVFLIPTIAGYAIGERTDLVASTPKHLMPRSLSDYTCKRYNLSVSSWETLQMDDYLHTYPNGAKTNLAQFCAENNITNFECAIGRDCSAGQLCTPIIGRPWWVAAAVQQLNYYLNSLNSAIDFSASIAKATAGKIIWDLHDPKTLKKAAFFQKLGMILTLAVAVVAMIAAAVFIVVPGTEAFGVMAATGAVLAVAQVSAIMKAQVLEKKALSDDPFTQWAALEGILADWRVKSQKSIADSFDAVQAAGVSTDDGIYKVLKGGQYCRGIQPKDLFDLERQLDRVLTVLLVGKILRAKKSFITVGNDECKHGGLDGALPIEEGYLSWCDRENHLLIDIVWDDDGDTGNKFYNARALRDTYDVTPEYIIKQSQKCHSQGRGPDYDSYTSDGDQPRTQLPDLQNDCVINLPICNLQDHAVHKAIKKHSTVRACRHYGGIQLP